MEGRRGRVSARTLAGAHPEGGVEVSTRVPWCVRGPDGGLYLAPFPSAVVVTEDGGVWLRVPLVHEEWLDPDGEASSVGEPEGRPGEAAPLLGTVTEGPALSSSVGQEPALSASASSEPRLIAEAREEAVPWA